MKTNEKHERKREEFDSICEDLFLLKEANRTIKDIVKGWDLKSCIEYVDDYEDYRDDLIETEIDVHGCPKEDATKMVDGYYKECMKRNELSLL